MIKNSHNINHKTPKSIDWKSDLSFIVSPMTNSFNTITLGLKITNQNSHQNHITYRYIITLYHVDQTFPSSHISKLSIFNHSKCSTIHRIPNLNLIPLVVMSQTHILACKATSIELNQNQCLKKSPNTLYKTSNQKLQSQ